MRTSRAMRTSMPFSSPVRKLCVLPSGSRTTLLRYRKERVKTLTPALPIWAVFFYPEGVPKRVVSGVGDAGIEATLFDIPALRRTDFSGKAKYLEVRKGITECIFGRVNRFWPSTKAMARFFVGSTINSSPDFRTEGCRTGSIRRLYVYQR